ncbi:MAG: hypothetical protein IJL87_03235, partial [Clostridia bacterium]|nr:hypothetical protein [Clostridia bacterium]
MKTKTRDLIFLLLIYLLAYYIGFKLCLAAPSPLLRYFVFDIIATVVTFIFSVILRNSSVYDPYWSLTPMVMSVFIFFTSKSFSIWQILVLTVFNIW